MSLSDAAESAFVEGLKAVEDGELKSALEKFTRACALNPNEPRYQGYRAWTQYHNHDSSENKEQREAVAEDSYQRLQSAVTECPDYDPLYVLLGTIHMAERRAQAAMEAFQKALEINPENNGALIGLKAAKKRSRNPTRIDAESFVPQTIPSPSISSISSNRISSKPSSELGNRPRLRAETNRAGNVFSNARLRAQIEELKRARETDRTDFNKRKQEQSEELETIKSSYETNIKELKEQISHLSQEKQEIEKNFDDARQTLQHEKDRITALAQEQASATNALEDTHAEIHQTILKAKAEAEQNEQEHSQERSQMSGELNRSIRRIQDLEDSLGAERQVLEVSHESIEDLSREFSQTKALYEQEIASLKEDHQDEIQKAQREQATLNKKIADLQQAQQSGARNNHDKELAIQNLKHREEEIQRDLDRRVELLTQTEKELKGKIATLDQQRLENETKEIELEKKQAQITELENQLLTATQSIEAQEKTVQDLDISLDDSRTFISRLQNELDASRAEVRQLREQKRDEEDRQSWIRNAEETLEVRETQLNELGDELTGAKEQIERLHNHTKQQQRDHDALLMKIEEVTTEASLKPSEEELDDLKRKSERVRFDLERAKKKTESAQRKIDDLERQKDLGEQEIQTLRAETGDFRSKFRRAQSELDKTISEKEGLLSQIQDLRSEASLRPTKNDLDKLRRELDDTRAQLGQQRDEAEEATRTIQALEHDRDEQLTTLEEQNATKVQSLVEDSAKKIQTLQDENAAQQKQLAELKEDLSSAEHQEQEQQAEKSLLQERIEELENQVSKLPSTNEIEFLRGQFEKSQEELLSARDRVEQERLKIEELERTIQEEQKNSAELQEKALKDQIIFDQAKTQKEALEQKYAKTAGTISTVLESIQTQLTAEKQKSEKLQQENETTITHLSSERDRLKLEVEKTGETLQKAKRQLEHIEKGFAQNKQTLESKLAEERSKRDELKQEIENQSELHLSQITDLKKGFSEEIEILEQEVAEQERLHQDQQDANQILETAIKEQEIELTAKLDNQALLVFDIKNDFDQKKKELSTEIQTLRDALSYAEEQLTEKGSELSRQRAKQEALFEQYSETQEKLRIHEEQANIASDEQSEAAEKVQHLEEQDNRNHTIIRQLREEAKEAEQALSQSVKAEQDSQQYLEDATQQVSALEAKLQSANEELAAIQSEQTLQKEDLTRQLKIAYTQVEQLEFKNEEQKEKLENELDVAVSSAVDQAREKYEALTQVLTEEQERLKSTLHATELRVADLQGENDQLRQSVISSEAQFSTSLNGVEQERDALRDELEAFEQEEERAAKRHDSIIGELKSQISSRDESLEHTAEHLEKMRHEFALKELEHEEAQEENVALIQALKEEISEAQLNYEQLKIQLSEDDDSQRRAEELENQHLAELKVQLKDARGELQYAKNETAEAKRELAQSKIEQSSKNEQINLELKRLKQEVDSSIQEKKEALLAVEQAQEQLRQSDGERESVFQRASDDLEQAKSHLEDVESNARTKQAKLFAQLEEAQRQIEELRELEEFSRGRLVEREKDVANLIREKGILEKQNQAFNDRLALVPASEEMQSELEQAQSELRSRETDHIKVQAELENELAELKAALLDSKRAREEAEEVFKSQFQKLELDFQSRVGELKSHFESQLQASSGMSTPPPSKATNASEKNLDIPELADESMVEVAINFTSEPGINPSRPASMESSNTIPAPEATFSGRVPPPPPPQASTIENSSSLGSSGSSEVAGTMSSPAGRNFASVEELLSALDLPFPELDESKRPEELPDESILDEEIVEERLSPESPPASESIATSSPAPGQSDKPKGLRRITTFLSKLGTGDIVAEEELEPSRPQTLERSDRHQVRFQMSFDNGQDFHLARVQDISETGVYLETAEPQPIGTELTLSPVGIPEFEELEFKALVVRSKPYAPHTFDKEPAGMGLRFVPMKDKSRKRLLYLIRKLEDEDIREQGRIDPYLGVRIPEPDSMGNKSGASIPVQVLGGGAKAGDLTYLLVNQGLRTHLSSVEDQPIDEALQHVRHRFTSDMNKGLLTKAECAPRLRLISTAAKEFDASKAKVIIEAVAEPLSIKRAVIKQLEKSIPREATIISVVSEGNMISAIGDSLRHPDRLCGLNFIGDPQQVGMVELVKGRLSSQEAVQATAQLIRKLDLKPIVIADDHGLLIQRILGFYFNEAGHLIEDGVSFEAIDEVIKGFGFTKGPLQLMDEFGFKFVSKNAHILESAFGERAKVPPSLLSLTNSGRKGRETGRGFYEYINGKSQGIDQNAYLDCGRSEPGAHTALPEEEIRMRLLLTMINEAARAIGDNIITSPGLLDMALVMSCGFPAFRKGLLHYGDSLRPTVLLAQLEDLERKHGSRFMPALYLRMLAENDTLFYQPQ